jgi:hypothetical protein
MVLTTSHGECEVKMYIRASFADNVSNNKNDIKKYFKLLFILL